MIPIHRVELCRNSLIGDSGALAVLKELCVISGAGIVIEVGTFLGCGSTVVFSKNSTNVYAVDNCVVDMKKRFDRPESHVHLLMSNLIQLGLSNVELVRMNSVEAATALDVMADLVFIDASHDALNVERDIKMWKPHVRPGGILCGDDYGVDSCPDVKPTVERVLLGVKHDGRIWWVST